MKLSIKIFTTDTIDKEQPAVKITSQAPKHLVPFLVQTFMEMALADQFARIEVVMEKC